MVRLLVVGWWSIHLWMDYSPFACHWIMHSRQVVLASKHVHVSLKRKIRLFVCILAPSTWASTSLWRFFFFVCVCVCVCVWTHSSRHSRNSTNRNRTSTTFSFKLVLWRSKRGLSRKSAHSVYWPIKLAFFLTVYPFGSIFSTSAVILVWDLIILYYKVENHLVHG